jgi:arylsulfatase A-like enzyme
MRLSTTFCRLFYLLAFALSIIFLPLDFLYRIDSLIKYQPYSSVFLDYSIMTVLMTAIALVIAGLQIFIVSIASKFSKFDKVDTVLLGNIFMSSGICLYCYFRVAKQWLIAKQWLTNVTDSMALDQAVDLKYKLILMLVGFVIIYFNIHKLLGKFNVNYKSIIKIVNSAVVIAVLVIVWNICTVKENAKNSLQAAGERHNIILITMDALSAEDMSLYGYKLDTTPNINNFARNCYIFDNMYANSNWTRPCVASLLRGVRPSTHRLISMSNYNNFSPDGIRHNNLPYYLKMYGYKCYAIVCNLSYAHPRANDLLDCFDVIPYDTIEQEYVENYKNTFKLYEISKNFTKYRSSANMWLFDLLNDYVPFANRSISSYFHQNKWENETYYPPKIPFEKAKHLLTETTKNTFLWIHVFTPHGPYMPPANFAKFTNGKDYGGERSSIATRAAFYKETQQEYINYQRLKYDEFLLYSDKAFGDFISYLKVINQYDNSLIIFSSDHGESFTKGYWGHGGPYLYNQLIHIPLVVHVPGQMSGKRISSNMEQIDIVPTILDIEKLPRPDWLEGESMVSAFNSGKKKENLKFAMQLEGNSIRGVIRKGTFAILDCGYKYIYNLDKQTEELYDIGKDPTESKNICSQNLSKCIEYRQIVSRQIGVKVQ